MASPLSCHWWNVGGHPRPECPVACCPWGPLDCLCVGEISPHHMACPLSCHWWYVGGHPRPECPAACCPWGPLGCLCVGEISPHHMACPLSCHWWNVGGGSASATTLATSGSTWLAQIWDSWGTSSKMHFIIQFINLTKMIDINQKIPQSEEHLHRRRSTVILSSGCCWRPVNFGSSNSLVPMDTNPLKNQCYLRHDIWQDIILLSHNGLNLYRPSHLYNIN